jgi:hypothetical protein
MGMTLRRYFGKISPLAIGNLVGHNGELVIDETTDYVYIMDGSTPGGRRILYTNVDASVGNLSGNVIPSTTNLYTLGNASLAWSNAYVGQLNTTSLNFNNNSKIFYYNSSSPSDLNLTANIYNDVSGLYLTENPAVGTLLYSPGYIVLESGNNKNWTFNNQGITTLPNGGKLGPLQYTDGIDLYARPDMSYAQVNFANVNYIYADIYGAQLQTSNVLVVADTYDQRAQIYVTDNITHTSNWYWYANNSMVFPDNTIQSTAFSNANIATLNSLVTNAAVQASNLASLVSNAASQQSSILSLNANITAANSAINTANAYNKSYTDTAISNLINMAPGTLDTLAEIAANLSVEANAIITITNNVNSVNANVAAANSAISTLTTNAATQAGQISSVNANVTAANAAIVTLNSNLSAANSVIASKTSYSNTNVAAYIANSIATDVVLSGNIIPASNVSYSLGNATNQWKGLYVSANTIYLGGVAISVAAGNILTVGGNVASYGNANVATYLPTDPTIVTLVNNAATQASGLNNLNASVVTIAGILNGIQTGSGFANSAQINAANSSITTLNANLNAANLNIATLTSNAASQASDITTLYSNAAAQAVSINNLTAGATSANTIISGLTTNVASQATDIATLYSNAGVQANLITGLLANITSANAAIVAANNYAIALNSTTNSNLSAANAQISILQSNVTSLNNTIVAFFGGALSYGNANVATYLPADATIISLFSNAATQANLISNINSNISAANTNITTLFTNAAVQANLITNVNANINAANSAITTINANIAAANTNITSLFTNAAVQANLITNVNANINAANTNITSLFTNASVQASNLGAIVGGTVTLANVITTGGLYWSNGVSALTTAYGNTQVSAYFVANTVAASNVQILTNGNIRLPTGGYINESAGTGTITLTPNISASATAGVAIGGSGYLLSANGTRNAVLNYNSVNGQFGIYTVNVYGNQANAIINGGAANLFGNIGGISSFFGNTFVANIYSQNYFYPNGTSILTGIGGTYSNSNVAAYLPTYSGNIGANKITANTGTFSGNVAVGNLLSTTQVYTPSIQFTVGGAQIVEDNALDLAILGKYQISVKANPVYQYTFNNDGSLSGPGGSFVYANGAVYGNLIATGIYWSNGVVFSSGGGGGSYGNTDVGNYLPTYAGNVNAAYFLGNGYYLSGIASGASTYSNTNVAAYLVSYNGNIAAGNLALTGGASGNISGTGYVVAGSLVANTGVYGNSFYWYNNNATLASTITGTFANANVAGYLPTYTGNVNAGNILLTANGNILAGSSTNMNIRTYGVYNVLTISGVAGGYNSPPYTNQSLTGGSGTGMTANYSSVGGYVTQSSLVVTNPGTGYKNGDVLTLPGGLGATVTLSNYNQNITTSKAYLWTFAQYDGGLTVPGNIIMPANSVVMGDFSNSTFGFRTMFQTITANSTTGIYSIPNGTSQGASWQAINNSNPNNASKIMITTNGTTDVQLVSGINGTGTYLPLSFYNNGAAQMTLYPNSNFIMGNGGSFSTTGNVNAGNVNATQYGNSFGTIATYTGNVTASNFVTTGAYGNISGANVITANTFVGTNATISGNLYSPSQTGKSAAIVAQNTAVTMDNIKVQWLNNGSVNANQLQLGSVSGTPAALYTYIFEAGTGGTPSGGSSSATLSTTYSNIGNPSGTAGDLYMVTATVGTNAYRISAITGSGYSNNLISIERLV